MTADQEDDPTEMKRKLEALERFVGDAIARMDSTLDAAIKAELANGAQLSELRIVGDGIVRELWRGNRKVLRVAFVWERF